MRRMPSLLSVTVSGRPSVTRVINIPSFSSCLPLGPPRATGFCARQHVTTLVSTQPEAACRICSVVGSNASSTHATRRDLVEFVPFFQLKCRLNMDYSPAKHLLARTTLNPNRLCKSMSWMKIYHLRGSRVSAEVEHAAFHKISASPTSQGSSSIKPPCTVYSAQYLLCVAFRGTADASCQIPYKYILSRHCF